MFKETFEFGTVHKCASLVDHKILHNEYLSAKIGFDAAEKESAKLSILFSRNVFKQLTSTTCSYFLHL